MSWLIAVEAISSGGGGSGSCIVLETAEVLVLPPVPLESRAEVQWDLCVVIGPRSVR